MDINGYLYAANMTNLLAVEISEEKWDEKLISELGSLRKLFIHMVRVRDVYRDGVRNGVIQFPGKLLDDDFDLIQELNRNKNELVDEFQGNTIKEVKMGVEFLTDGEVLGLAIQHEGIHQGQYFVALKQSGIELPEQWIQDWNMS